MFCFKCGEKLVQGAAFCHRCGTDVSVITRTEMRSDVRSETAVVPEQSKKSIAKNSEIYFSRVFSRPLFLTTTILFSICALFSCVIFISDGSFFAAVINVLTVLLMWGLYTSAKEKATLQKYKRPLELARVVALINYIVGWITVGELALLGINIMCEPLFVRSGYYGYPNPFMNHTNRSGAYVAVGIIVMLAAIGYVFVNLIINRKILWFVKTFVKAAKKGDVVLGGLKEFRVKLLILSGVNATLSIGVFLAKNYVAGLSYFFGNYYVSGIEVVKTLLPAAFMVAAVCCFVVSLKPIKVIKQNIVDNSKKDDII